MRDERGGLDLLRLPRELRVFEGRQRLAATLGCAIHVEEAEAGPVGLPAALTRQAVRRFKEPERGAHPSGAAAHSK